MWVVRLLEILDNGELLPEKITGYQNEETARIVFSRLVEKYYLKADEDNLNVLDDNKNTFYASDCSTYETIRIDVFELQVGTPDDYKEYERIGEDKMKYQIIGYYGNTEYWDMANLSPDEIIMSTIGNKMFQISEDDSIVVCDAKDFDGVPCSKDGKFFVDFDEIEQSITIIRKID